LEVDDAERGPEIPVRLRRKVERPRLAGAAHFHVLPGALADRHALMGQVGQVEQRDLALMLDRRELNFHLLDLRGTELVRLLNVRRVLALPLVDKPIIQYGVEEAVASGVDNIILVTGRGKNAIEDHFDRSVELESFLEARGKRDQLDEVRKISNMINFAYVRQGEPLGLGHAVLVARELVGNEPFAVILADDVIDADPPAVR